MTDVACKYYFLPWNKATFCEVFCEYLRLNVSGVLKDTPYTHLWANCKQNILLYSCGTLIPKETSKRSQKDGIKVLISNTANLLKCS